LLTEDLTPGLVAAAAGDRQRLRLVLARLASDRAWVYYSVGGWLGRYALDHIDRDAFLAGLPNRTRAAELARLGDALRAELTGDEAAIRAAWMAWLDAPLNTRWFDYDPSLDAWAAARLGR